MIHRFGDVEVDRDQRAVQLGGRTIPLTAKPFALLELLIENQGAVVSKEMIVDAVWDGKFVSDEALYSAVRTIRKAIDPDGAENWVRTVYGRGWRLVDSSSAADKVLDVPPPSESPILYPPIITILPFECIADEPSLRLIADGMTEDVSTLLSKFRDVRIAARTSLAPGNEEVVDGTQPGQRSGAGFVLNGTLRPSRSGLRLTVQVIDAADETQVWAGQYDLSAYRMSESQDEASLSIATSLVSTVNDYQLMKCNSKDLADLTPWECYLRGKFLLATFDSDVQSEAIRLFERGIALNPRFGVLYGALSYALNTQYKAPTFVRAAGDGADRRTDVRIRAHTLAQKTVALNPRIPFGWVALARSHLGLGELHEAISAARRALEFNPNFGWAHFILGYCLWPLNRPEEAIEAFDKALQTLTEESFQWAAEEGKACALTISGRYEEAIQLARRAQVEPYAGHFAYCAEVCSLIHLSQHEEARRAFKKALEVNPGFGMALIEHDQPLPDPTVRNLISNALRLASRDRARAS